LINFDILKQDPTLGIDKDAITRVNGGISINSIAFDVEYYSQNITVRIFLYKY